MIIDAPRRFTAEVGMEMATNERGAPDSDRAVTARYRRRGIMKVRKTKLYGMAIGTVLALGLGSTVSQADPTVAETCEAGKTDSSGKYLACLAKAEMGLVSSGDAAKYDAALAKCESKLVGSYEKLEAAALAAGSSCPSTGDANAVLHFLDGCVAGLADAVSGGTLPPDVHAVIADVETCTTDVETCVVDVATCDGIPSALPPGRTGQTTSYGPGSDGEVRAGGPERLFFVENGDGTITDNTTGLMWEMKDMSGGIHDAGYGFTWSTTATGDMDGTIATSFLATLNSGSFAGHNDWRVPNLFEMMTLVNLEAGSPAIHSAFDRDCTPGCTLPDCSCTSTYATDHVTSSVYQPNANSVWAVRLWQTGAAETAPKNVGAVVRAVRTAS